MFEDVSSTPWFQWLYVTAQQWTAAVSEAWHRQRSHYPIPPGLTGLTAKLLLQTALPWLAR